ncbi:hypothetical protein, partial [Frankia nepalensis]
MIATMVTAATLYLADVLPEAKDVLPENVDPDISDLPKSSPGPSGPPPRRETGVARSGACGV